MCPRLYQNSQLGKHTCTNYAPQVNKRVESQFAEVYSYV